MKISCESTNELKGIANQLIEAYPDKKVFAFHASMGAGKTTFINDLCKAVGVLDVVNSPTFSIINEYETSSGEPVYHFDFYRLKKEEEALDIGIEEYFYSGHYCFLEWPEKIESYLPEETIDVQIKVNQETGLREFSFGL